jgi:hypothetical protein
MNFVENCKTALAYWATVPPENVTESLGAFQEDSDCGLALPTCSTICCFGGWLCAMPEFIALGVKMGSIGEPVMGKAGVVSEVALRLFGPGAAGFFKPRGVSSDDAYALTASTDHEIVTHRLERQLDRLERE